MIRQNVAVPAWLRSALWALLLCQACDVYDRSLLVPSEPSTLSVGACGDGVVSEDERCDTAIETGQPGACPSDCPMLDPCVPRAMVGSGCQAFCAELPIERAWNGDQCCPVGVGPAEDSDCGSCGDGVIGPLETCDPPESCATAAACSRPKSCIIAVFSGDPSLCTSDCRLALVQRCRNDDGCCPSNCDSSNDNDCSATCGNGVLEASAGETCEPSVAGAACPTDCDDGVACTEDLLGGTPEQCNVECANIPIEYAKSGDGCCPPGANAVADSDCAPVCGNSIVEPGEPCDGGAQCDAMCQRILHTAIKHRYSFDGASSSRVVTDTIGSQNGSAKSVYLAGDGSIALAGGSSDQYIDFPCAIVSGLSALTVEAWVTWGGGDARQRIFDFGAQDGSGSGTSYFLLSPQLSGGYFGSVLNFTPAAADTGNDHTAADAAPLSSTGIHQVAATFGDGTLQLYLDGKPVASSTGITDSLSQIDFSHCWLGRSQFDVAPYFSGTFYELRVYEQALNASEIGISASMGPDAQ